MRHYVLSIISGGRLFINFGPICTFTYTDNMSPNQQLPTFTCLGSPSLVPPKKRPFPIPEHPTPFSTSFPKVGSPRRGHRSSIVGLANHHSSASDGPHHPTDRTTFSSSPPLSPSSDLPPSTWPPLPTVLCWATALPRTRCIHAPLPNANQVPNLRLKFPSLAHIFTCFTTVSDEATMCP